MFSYKQLKAKKQKLDIKEKKKNKKIKEGRLCFNASNTTDWMKTWVLSRVIIWSQSYPMEDLKVQP